MLCAVIFLFFIFIHRHQFWVTKTVYCSRFLNAATHVWICLLRLFLRREWRKKKLKQSWRWRRWKAEQITWLHLVLSFNIEHNTLYIFLYILPRMYFCRSICWYGLFLIGLTIHDLFLCHCQGCLVWAIAAWANDMQIAHEWKSTQVFCNLMPPVTNTKQFRWALAILMPCIHATNDVH